MKLIVALGDSTTAGTPLFLSPLEAPPNGRGDERSQYSYWLMQLQPAWRVLNRGINGERSDQIAARFDRDVLGAKPDAAIIIAGVNDVYQDRELEHVTTHLRDMYDRAKAAKIPVVAGTIVPFNTATPEQNRKMQAINQWIAAQPAKDPNVAVADTRAAVAARGDANKLAASPDGLHPDVNGYRQMADALEPVLRRVLEKR